MTRLLFSLLIGAFMATSPALATPEALAEALQALRDNRAEEARRAASRIQDQPVLDVVIWTQLRSRQGSFAEYEDFLARNPDWPGLPYLRRQGEYAIPENADPARVIAYFADVAPQTATGVLRLAEAQPQAANARIITAWTSLPMSGSEAATYLVRYGDLLEDHHTARLDMLLWEGEADRLDQMLPLVPEGWQRLAAARAALRQQVDGVDARIAAVPAGLQTDPGLAFERMVWRMRAGNWAGAADLMLASSRSTATLGRPEKWADRRATLARDVMREGRFSRAYDLAANHHVDPAVDGSAYADLEWIAGYTALRLGQANRAVTHFERFRTAVFTPISMGRAGYWLGRAHEAAGNREAAAQAYVQGAQYQSSFYGQLAADRGGFGPDPAMLGTETYPPWRSEVFLDSTVLQAALTLYQADEDWLSERFLTHLSESQDRDSSGALAQLALDLGDYHIALRIAKRAASQGWELMDAYFPLVPWLIEADLEAEPAMVLSIARRESEFDPLVQSGVGALGLMQVMPGTGRDTAAELGLPFDPGQLLTDPAYNATLGAAYIDYLTTLYGNNPVLIAAAYNAGPSRADSWLERFGDPRDPTIDVIDWIEAIPFAETRNYIMRVAESLRIYEARLSGTLPQETLRDLLTRR